ncbi:unnamed protein product [Durusdinium trenchii]|uniref:Adenylate cyclase n=1 Tax=Durusdinium trenchii TaxID=1381693 RepID=A0ABP0R0P9_9DINO
MTALPSALPEANGFLALVADAPIAVDPEGARLPGFGDQLYGLSCWHLPLAGPKEVYVGFEYVCPQGYRFLAPPYKCSGLSTGKQPEVEGKKGRRRREQTSLEEGEYESVPLCGYRLYVPCVQHRRQKGRRGDPPCISQLTRIWVQTPHRRELIQAEPRVAIVDTKGEVGSDGRPKEVIMTGGKVVLPAGMLVQLVLPYAYFRADTPVPSFWDLGHDAERCRLWLGPKTTRERVALLVDLATPILIRQFVRPTLFRSDSFSGISLISALHSTAHSTAQFCAEQGAAEGTTPATRSVAELGGRKVAIRSWGRYVPWPVVQNLLVAGVAVQTQLEEREVSLFFSDMAGFTSIVEQLVPEQTLVLLSRYFNDMSKIIEHHDGVVIEFIGDAILAVFGAPAKIKEHALACVRAMMKMQRGVQRINQWSKKKGLPHVSIRCGIHSGWVSVGNLGFHSRLKFGVIGEHSTLPAKLEELNKTYGTSNLISEATYRRLQDEFVVRPIDYAEMYGEGEDLEEQVYEVVCFLNGRQSFKNNLRESLAKKYEQALRYYVDRKFDKAAAIWREVSLQTGQYFGLFDKASVVMRKRACYYQRHPPAPNWRGIWTLSREPTAEDGVDEEVVYATWKSQEVGGEHLKFIPQVPLLSRGLDLGGCSVLLAREKPQSRESDPRYFSHCHEAEAEVEKNASCERRAHAPDCCEGNATSSKAATDSTSLIRPETEEVHFKLNLVKSSAAHSLGIDVDLTDGNAILVEAVHEGLVLEWNRRNPTNAVQKHDRIVAVNGIEGNADLMAQKCRDELQLHLLVSRLTAECGR